MNKVTSIDVTDHFAVYEHFLIFKTGYTGQGITQMITQYELG